MIIGLSGYAQSGKDTTAELLCLNYKYKRQAFADPMRHALMIINPKLDSITRLSEYVDDYGWDTAKQNPEVRRLLQVIGTDFGRKMLGENIWVKMLMDKLNYEDRVVISDVRFPTCQKPWRLCLVGRARTGLDLPHKPHHRRRSRTY